MDSCYDGKLTVNQGNAVTLAFTVSDPDTGLAVDLTGSTVVFMVKADLADANADALITKTCTITDAEAGECSADLATTDTDDLEAGSYYYDIKITDAASKPVTSPPLPFVIESVVNRS